MTTSNTPIDLSHLSPADRIHLVQDLWDRIHDDALAVPPTAEQRAELQCRDAEMESGDRDRRPYAFAPGTSSFRTHSRNRSSHVNRSAESSVKTHRVTSSGRTGKKRLRDTGT